MEKSCVFVIEDISEMADLMALYVNNTGHMYAQVFSQAEDALLKIKENVPQAILLDLNLPGISGFEFLKKIRKNYKTIIPIIIVSARDADDDIVLALNLGADEFISKPFSPRVLIARLESHLRRAQETKAITETTLRFDDYTLFENSCVLKKGSKKIQLSQREFDILDFLARNAGQSVSPKKIYEAVWKQSFGDITAVAVYIQRLRKKIEKNPSCPKYIRTVFRSGYKFVIP